MAHKTAVTLKRNKIKNAVRAHAAMQTFVKQPLTYAMIVSCTNTAEAQEQYRVNALRERERKKHTL